MKDRFMLIAFLTCTLSILQAQEKNDNYHLASLTNTLVKEDVFHTNSQNKFLTSSDFLDAAINSINSLNSLVKKEAYRTKITSFNNPTSSDMGFNLENEIQTALKPLLAKAKNTSPSKFSGIISSLIATPQKTVGSTAKTSMPIINPLFSTILSLVGNLTVQEKKLTRDDLDTFIISTSKYFVQYEKLNGANILFDQNLDRLNARLKDLQFDLKEYMLDMITILYKGTNRTTFKNQNTEELFLKYLDKQKMELALTAANADEVIFPSDGIKAAKDIAYTLQKLFAEYQKVYGENYQQIRTILTESKSLGKNINTRQVDASLKELEELYTDSKSSDVLGLRLTTLMERLKWLVATEQGVAMAK